MKYIIYSLYLLTYSTCSEVNVTESNLDRLVEIFKSPGAFQRVDEIFGDNFIDINNSTFQSCPDGDEGLNCRREEAKQSIECPEGDCYCYNCSVSGPKLWAACCRESSKCCSHLAAACRNCDHPILIPFCSKHFKKCLNESNNSIVINQNVTHL